MRFFRTCLSQTFLQNVHYAPLEEEIAADTVKQRDSRLSLPHCLSSWFVLTHFLRSANVSSSSLSSPTQ